MNRSLVGLLVGMALGFAGWFGGFGAFLLVAALGAIGWAVGRMSEDEGFDWREFLATRDRRGARDSGRFRDSGNPRDRDRR
ncbi:hypothetical protein [Streptomyces sp. NPDC088348]|uniref:hypothetical protein n=1 Tax=Streptomyces sp. NPDC088348 TaxID=3365853 RepID=UPI0037F13971